MRRASRFGISASTSSAFFDTSGVRDERVFVHCLHDLGIAREILVLEVQHVCVRRDMAQSLERGKSEGGRRHLEGEALADWCCQFRLMLERIEARHDTAGAVTQEIDRNPRGATLPDSPAPRRRSRTRQASRRRSAHRPSVRVLANRRRTASPSEPSPAAPRPEENVQTSDAVPVSSFMALTPRSA